MGLIYTSLDILAKKQTKYLYNVENEHIRVDK